MNKTALISAAQHSRNCNELVRVKVGSLETRLQAVELLRDAFPKLVVDWCDAGSEGVDVWGYEPDSPEGSYAWRLSLTQA